MINFSGSRILVVGGSSGIGLSTAKVAHEHGAAVTIASRSSDKVDAAVRTIGPGTSGRLIDVTSNSSVETFFADMKNACPLATVERASLTKSSAFDGNCFFSQVITAALSTKLRYTNRPRSSR